MRYATDGVYFVGPDRHFPFECKRFSNIALSVVRLLKPDGYIDLGDAHDFFQLSEYDSDPRRANRIEDDIALYSAFIDQVEAALPKGSVFHQLEGNHEDRLRRYTWRRAPAAVGLVSSVPKELGFKDRNARGRVKFIWHPINDWESLKLGDTVVHHGHYFNKHTAVNNLERYRGVNLIHGHTHRVQYAHNGDHWCATLGHGSDESMTSHQPTPNDWQQAFAVLTVLKGKGSIEIFTVTDGCVNFRGKLIKG